MTIGTSAPPTGSTSSTPSSSPTSAEHDADPHRRRRTTSTHRRARARRAARRRTATGRPGKTTGRVVISSCSLAKVTSEPAKRHRADQDRERGRGQRELRDVGRRRRRPSCELEQRDQRGGAAADAVEQRDQLRHLGHLHPVRRRRRRPTVPTAIATRIGGRWSRSCVEEHDRRRRRTAPAAPIRLPRRAVLGRRQALEREDEADRGDQVGELRPDRGGAHSPRLLGGRRLAACGEHLQHPVGDHEAADHVDAGEHDRDQPDHQRERGRRRGR